MEPKQIPELTPSVLQNLQLVSSEYRNSNEISIYTGTLKDQCVLENVVLIKKAFPALPLDFYDVFIDMVRESNFTDERLRDAVKHVICTCPYPTPTIANFISFDKKIKLNTYDEMLKKSSELGSGVWKLYKPVKLPERSRAVWVHIDDMKAAGLKEYIPNFPKP